ncbi:MAG: hypothetical protein J3R72DRAFT_33006 [Linnemannia gamsii]|nr:MAG: hypothetical protein J3R72DRAFT_33006 [Linnemannia gamsii]
MKGKDLKVLDPCRIAAVSNIVIEVVAGTTQDCCYAERRSGCCREWRIEALTKVASPHQQFFSTRNTQTDNTTSTSTRTTKLPPPTPRRQKESEPEPRNLVYVHKAFLPIILLFTLRQLSHQSRLSLQSRQLLLFLDKMAMAERQNLFNQLPTNHAIIFLLTSLHRLCLEHLKPPNVIHYPAPPATPSAFQPQPVMSTSAHTTPRTILLRLSLPPMTTSRSCSTGLPLLTRRPMLLLEIFTARAMDSTRTARHIWNGTSRTISRVVRRITSNERRGAKVFGLSTSTLLSPWHMTSRMPNKKTRTLNSKSAGGTRMDAVLTRPPGSRARTRDGTNRSGSEIHDRSSRSARRCRGLAIVSQSNQGRKRSA